MGYRLIVPTTTTAESPTTPASSYDLWQKIQAAVAVGGFTAIGLTTLMWSVLAVITEVRGPVPWRVWLTTLALALVIGIGVMCWEGVGWVVAVAKRAWDVDDDERAYQRELERQERERQEEAARSARHQVVVGDDVDGNPSTLTDQQRLDLVAQALLERHYIQGRPATREAMERAGLCTQADWNLVNKALLGSGLKKGYTMLAPDFTTAWARWREAVKVEEGYLQVLKNRGQWYALERIV